MFDGIKRWVTCRVCHNSQNICIEFFKQVIIKKIVGYVGRIHIRTSICKKHNHLFCLFMVGKNVIQIGNVRGCSSWILLVRANSKMTMSRIWRVGVKPTQSIILQFLTIYARNRFVSLFAFFEEWYVVERCICVVETKVNRRLFDSGVICPLNTSKLPSGSTLITSQWKNRLTHSDTFYKLSPWNNMSTSSKLPVLTTISLSPNFSNDISYVGKSESSDSSFICSKYMYLETDNK